MEITVHLEQKNEHGYQATSLIPKRLVGEGITRAEALDRLRQLVQQAFETGELVQFEVAVPEESPASKSLAGIWKDHPDIDEVVENILEYRRQVDADPDRP